MALSIRPLRRLCKAQRSDEGRTLTRRRFILATCTRSRKEVKVTLAALMCGLYAG